MIEPRRSYKKLKRFALEAEDRVGTGYRFDRNEKATPFNTEHLKAILADIHPDELVAYPQPEPLYQQLTAWLGVDRSEVLLASGSDTAIKAVYEVYVEEGDEVVVLRPTYGMYVVYTQMFGATPIPIGYDPDWHLPVARVRSAITDRTKLVAIANPNNTGTVFCEEDLLAITSEARQHGALVMIDEAYFHYYGETMIRWINEYDNLAIIRTFSKAFGVASLRIGYTVASKGVIEQLYKAKLTHEITAFAARVGEYLLDHPEILDNNVREVNEGKNVLYRRLPEIGCKVLPSVANFVFFEPPQGVDSKEIVRELRERRIFIRGPFADIPFTGHLRITVGSGEQMGMFCSVVEELVRVASRPSPIRSDSRTTAKRVAVVGAGTIADWHVRALKIAGLQVTAVGTRPGSQRLAEFAARHAIPAVFEDWRDMLAHPEWDGLVIAVRTEGTVDVLSAATPIGVPILVEKPTAWTSAVLQPLVESAAQRLIVGYNRRFYRPVQEARAEAQRRSPLLAQLMLPEAVKPQGKADPERRYLLPFLENSCHGFDLARFVLGPLHVERVDRHVDSDDRLVSLGAVLSSDRGDLVQLVANWDAPANFGLSLNGAGWRFDLCPFELATIYKGMDVFDPTDEVPIRRYVPRVAGRIPVDEIDTKEKPGFVRQAEALKDMMAGKDPPEFAASLPDAVAALRLCEELLGPYVPTYPR